MLGSSPYELLTDRFPFAIICKRITSGYSFPTKHWLMTCWVRTYFVFSNPSVSLLKKGGNQSKTDIPYVAHPDLSGGAYERLYP